MRPGLRGDRHVRAGARAWGVLGAALLGTALAPAALGFTLEDVAWDEGLRFARAGDRENDDPNFVEIMGGGACWLDADDDGFLDLFLVNGWLNDTLQAGEERPTSRLYRNLGSSEGPDFEDATLQAGLALQGWTQACAAADADADGDEDLLVVGYGIQGLFRNEGDGTFTNVTLQSGISAEGKCPGERCWGSGAAWADYDRDGCLDVYVINFVKYRQEDGGLRGPSWYDGQPNQLYRSDCDGTFTDVTAAAKADGDPGPDHAKDWGVTWLDYDLDGWMDLYIASDGTPNILLRNNGNGTFTDKAAEAGADDPRNGMGLVAGDCDGDGDEELYFTHYAVFKESSWWGWDGFYVNRGDGTYEDHSGEGDLQLAWPYVKWGVGWQDLDNDGDLDIHVATGHTENSAPDAEQKPLLWLGDGACRWTDHRSAAGPAMQLERMSRGSQYADYDHDGDVDMVVVNLMGGPVVLARNSGAEGRWIEVELRQPGGNPRGIGAWVNVTLPDGEVLHRRMMPYSSVHGSNPARLHVGLGSHAEVNVTVAWPDAWAEETFPGLAAGQLLRLHRGGLVQNDTLAPRTALAADGVPGSNGWWRSTLKVTLSAEDLGVSWISGVARTEARLDGGALIVDPGPLELGEGPHTLRFRSLDRAGNDELWSSRFLGVDATAPSSTGSLSGTLVGGWYQGPVSADLQCGDQVSGVDRIEWRLDDEPWRRYEPGLRLTRPGEHLFAWRCVDAAGNAEAVHSLSLAIDLGHPETWTLLRGTLGAQGWWRSEVTLALEASAAPRSLAQTHLRVDGGAAQPYEGPVVLAGDGAHELEFWSVDDAGNAEPARREALRIDATPPTLAMAAAGPHLETPGALIVGRGHKVVPSAADATSGMGLLEGRIDQQPWREGPRALRVSGEGEHVVELRARDLAGNEAALARRVVLDLTPPRVAVVLPPENSVEVGEELVLPLPVNPTTAYAILVGAAPLEAEVGDELSGVARVTFYVQETPVVTMRAPPWRWTWALPPATDYDYDVFYEAEDGVGNAAKLGFPVWATGAAEPLLPPGLLPAAPLPLDAGDAPEDAGPAGATVQPLLLGTAVALAGARRRARGPGR